MEEKIKYTEKKEFILIPELLSEDNEKIKELKSIYQKEEEYVNFLGPIESFIAYYYYYDNPKLKDVDVKKAIRSIKANLDKDADFFNNIFEKELIGVISLSLRDSKKKITKHELLLVLNYILWSIDNRSHMGYSKAYLDWVCDFFHLLDKKEKDIFNKNYDNFGEIKGLNKEVVKIMKDEESDFELPAEEITLSRVESEGYIKEDEKGNEL